MDQIDRHEQIPESVRRGGTGPDKDITTEKVYSYSRETHEQLRRLQAFFDGYDAHQVHVSFMQDEKSHFVIDSLVFPEGISQPLKNRINEILVPLKAPLIGDTLESMQMDDIVKNVPPPGRAVEL